MLDALGLLGVLSSAVGGSIVFFTVIFSLREAESAANITLLASIMSVFAFIGFVLVALGSYAIIESASRPK